MAADVDVQYFSHLNGLVLDNKWGDMIRLLDACLVNGVELSAVTSASIDEQGDVHLTLFAPHKALLLQVVELTGFEPTSLNQKYRIKGVPSETQLILKPHVAIAETLIASKGTGKLAALGYDIIFRDDNDVKRVYRAKDPSAQHPFIRVDESLVSDDGGYTSTYAKYAMVGLLEHMDHIDDFENPDVLQLPFNPTNLSENWKITGSGTSCSRGWSRWYWAHYTDFSIGSLRADSRSPSNSGRSFLIAGDSDAFYMQLSPSVTSSGKTCQHLSGTGLFNSALNAGVVPNWFLMSLVDIRTAGDDSGSFAVTAGGRPLSSSMNSASFMIPVFNETTRLEKSVRANPILPSYRSGSVNLYANTDMPVLEIPFSDTDLKLRGSLKHVFFSAKNLKSAYQITPAISESSMYVYHPSNIDYPVFYLGELW